MENDNKQESQRAKVETLAEDMARVIEGDKEGLIKKIIHEQEQSEMEKKNLSPESQKNKLFMYAGFALVFISLFVFLFAESQHKDNTVPVVVPAETLIFHDKSFFIEIGELNQKQIAASIKNEVDNSSVKIGGVEGIYLTVNKQIIGFHKFTNLVESSLSLEDGSISDNFLLGVVNGNSKDLFILLKTESMIDVFPLLRSWEDKMFNELAPFFGYFTSQDNKYLATKDFQDEIIENKNARVLLDDSNQIVLMYVFADDKSIIITNTASAVREVMLRLLGSEVKK